ncbi:MAG: pirin family protein [Bryobacterales bacterium]|nr:pirin family protein [Bryobacterales bacterium]
MQSLKPVRGVYSAGAQYWVGDGFPVRNLFPSNPIQRELDPFLLLDYAGPADFPPANKQRGVGEHPHRGFETVTVVYQGQVAHRDSSGTSGIVSAGGVQWMTAGSGVVHEEMHSMAFTQAGGTFEAIQLWVNLPRRLKMTAPKHQLLDHIPEMKQDGARIRVIAGTCRVGEHIVAGPAETHTPIEMYDVTLAAGASLDLAMPARQNAALFVLRGEVKIAQEGGSVTAGVAQLAAFTGAGVAIRVSAAVESRFLLLSGEPIDEPIVSHGPFVMSTREELMQAIEDYRSGRMGHLPA